MSAVEVDTWLASVDDPKRSTLASVRQTILSIVPEAEQGLSYGVPVFRLGGRNIAGLSAAKAHLTYLPHSGSVTATLTQELAAYRTTKGAVQFPIDEPLPRDIVELLIATRRAEI